MPYLRHCHAFSFAICIAALLTTSAAPAQTTAPQSFTVATQSLAGSPAPSDAWLASISLAVRSSLNAPSFLALQQLPTAAPAQLATTLAARIASDAAAASQSTSYAVCSPTGSSAILYLTSTVTLVSCLQPAPETYTDSTGAQQPLFATLPLVLTATLHLSGQPDFPLTLISADLATDPALHALQSTALAALLAQHQSAGEHVLLAGGFNTTDTTAFGLTDLSAAIPAPDRYSALVLATPAALDRILVSTGVSSNAQLAYLHLNTASTTPYALRDPALATIVPLINTGTSLTPTSQNFGSVIVGQSSSPFAFTLTNYNGYSVDITSVVSSNPTDFPQTNNCTTLASNATCTINIPFTPAATGARSGTLTVTTNDPLDPTLSSSLTGTGTASTTTATLTPSAAAFPSTVVGQTSPGQQFILTNTGNTTIGNIVVTASGDFSATYGCTTLAPQATCAINVVFSPTAPGTRTGLLTVNSTSSSSPLSAPLAGLGLSNLKGLTLSTYALNLGSVESGSVSPAALVTVTNNDPTAVTFSASNSSSGEAFPLTGSFQSTNSCGTTLASGASCILSITFAPQTTGTLIGTLTIVSSASDGTQVLSLSGNGTAYTLTIADASITVSSGNTANYAVTLTPVSAYSGTVTLSCTVGAAPGVACNPVATTLGPVQTVTFAVTTTPKYPYGIQLDSMAPVTLHPGSLLSWILGCTGLLALLLPLRTRRLARAAGLLALLFALLLSTTGCSGKYPAPNADYTLPGTYPITLTAVDSANVTQSAHLTLVVQ